MSACQHLKSCSSLIHPAMPSYTYQLQVCSKQFLNVVRQMLARRRDACIIPQALRANVAQSMPLTLPHESFFESAIFQIADEIAVASLSLLLLSSLSSSTASPPRTARIAIWRSIGRRWVVCRAWLESDRLTGIQMACHSLYGCRNSALLNFHRGSSLATRADSCLLVERLLLLRWCCTILSRRHLCLGLAHHSHLTVRTSLL